MYISRNSNVVLLTVALHRSRLGLITGKHQRKFFVILSKKICKAKGMIVHKPMHCRIISYCVVVTDGLARALLLLCYCVMCELGYALDRNFRFWVMSRICPGHRAKTQRWDSVDLPRFYRTVSWNLIKLNRLTKNSIAQMAEEK